ncbi:MAG: dipeptidyl carboxypeptidase II, partial [Arenibacter sp.]
MKKVYFLFLISVLIFACKDSKTNNNLTSQKAMNITNNPLLVESTLPYGAPDFAKIDNSHFREALLQGMDEKREIIEKIAKRTEAATFENTILALEKSGVLLDRVRNVFSALTGANTNDTLQAVQEEMAP